MRCSLNAEPWSLSTIPAHKMQRRETVQHILDTGGHAFAVQANVANDLDVRRMVTTITETYGPITALVNNAGITRHIPMHDLESVTDDVWNESLDVNVKGMFHCARAVTEGMRQAGGGSIVNLGKDRRQYGFGLLPPLRRLQSGRSRSNFITCARTLTTHSGECRRPWRSCYKVVGWKRGANVSSRRRSVITAYCLT